MGCEKRSGLVGKVSSLAAIAASTALPPAFNISNAACVERGCEVAAMPPCAYTGDRPANGNPVGLVPPQLFICGSTGTLWSGGAGKHSDESGILCI